MPTVPTQTEAIHYFRAVQAFIFSLLGSLLIILSLQALTLNYMWTTIAALGAVSVVVPSMLAMRRARMNTPGGPSVAHLRLSRLITVGNSAICLLIVAAAWAVPHFGHANLTILVFCVLVGLYLLPVAYLVRFASFAVVGVAILIGAIVPVYVYGASAGSAVAGLVTGLLLWIASFLVFTRSSQ